MSSSEVHAWADSLQFRRPVNFDEVRRTALLAKGPRQSGWYLLSFADGSFYIGESVDLRSRMGGHALKWGAEISTVRLLPKAASKQQLHIFERTLIRELGQRCKLVRNVTHANTTAGRNALEELLSEADQQKWAVDPRGFNAQDGTPLKDLSEQEVRYSTAARRYRDHPDQPRITRLLRDFLEACVPVPRATEFQYWSVSTGTYSGSAYPRNFCVSAGRMEVYVVHGVKRSPGAIQGFLNVRCDQLFPDKRAQKAFERRHRQVRIRARDYVDAGDDLITLEAPDLSSMEGLLADVSVTNAAAQLVIDVMRKHFCVYTRYHCPQLVNLAYPELRRHPMGAPLTDDVRNRAFRAERFTDG